MTALQATPQIAVSNPFKFLDYYIESDKEKFSGRQRDVREVLARVTTQRTSVLYARSGLGKTSLLLAGVFPALRERGYRPIYVRTLKSPLADLAAAVEQDSGASGDLTEFLRRITSERPVVLALDQFEEFFIRFESGSPERTEFVTVLGELISDASLNLRVLVSLREDYLANLGEFRQELPQLFTTEYRLLPLTAFGARQAITQPLTVANIAYDPRLVGRLVDLLAKEGFDPVLLQIICTEVFQEAMRAKRERVSLKRQDLEDIRGGLDEVLSRYLDRAIEDLPDGLHLVARTILDALITLERTKRAVTRDHFVGSDFVATEKELDEVLRFLGKKRLLRAETRNGEEWYELKHDRLVDTVLAWIDGDPHFFDYREARNQILNLSRQSNRWRQNPEILLARGAIEDIVGKSDFRDRLALDNIQLEMTVRSCVYRQDEHLDPEHLRHWCQLLCEQRGDKTLVDIMVDALDSESSKMRNGAALAAQELKIEDSRLAEKLLRRTLEDKQSKVRRAAGAALAKVAGSAQLEALEKELGSSDRQRRRQARETLADFEGSRKKLRRASRLNKWRARRIHARRQRERHQVAIVTRGRAGALYGLVGGLVWTMIFGVGFSVALTWTWGPNSWSWGSGPGSWPLMAVQLSILTLLLVVPTSSLIGWRVSLKAAEIAALSGSEQWGRTVRKSVILNGLFFVPTLLSITLYLFFRTDTGLAPVSLIIGWLAFSALVVFLLSWAVSLAQNSMGHGWTGWLWLAVSCWSLPMTVSVLCRQGIFMLDHLDLEPFLALILLLEIVLCWLAFVIGYCLSRTQQAHPRQGLFESSPPARRQAVSRSLVLSLAALLPGWFHYHYGFDAVPFPLPIVRPTSAIDTNSGQGTLNLTVNLSPGFDTSYAQVQFDTKAPRMLTVSTSKDVRVWINNIKTRSALVFGHVDLAATSTTLESRATTLSLKLYTPRIVELEGKSGQATQTEDLEPQKISWRWHAPESGVVFFDTVGSDFDTILDVRSESSPNRVFASNDDGGPGKGTSQLELRAKEGEIYFFAIRAYGALGSRASLRWAYDKPPSSPEIFGATSSELPAAPQGDIPASRNDHFTVARELSGKTGLDDANNSSATHDASDPSFLLKRSLWWTWTAPGVGRAVFQTADSSFDTLLGVYRRAEAGWQTVAENDDGGGGLQSRIGFFTEHGVTYHIAVGGVGDQTGSIRLGWEWESVAESSADSFGAPLALGQQAALATEQLEVFALNTLASAEPGEPAHAGQQARSSVWWALPPSWQGGVELRVEAQGFSPIVAVYVGETLAGLRTIASHDSGDSKVAITGFEAHRGQTYRIVVDSRDERSGFLVLKVSRTSSF